MSQKNEIPNSTATRVALWRALHLLKDTSPHLLKDDLALELVRPDPLWMERPDMHLQGTAPFRASILARSQFIEDLLEKERNFDQYVILGSGLDTFSQRRPRELSELHIFEIDQPDTIEWKENRLRQLGYKGAKLPTFIPVNFESQISWWMQLQQSGFKIQSRALVAAMGVTMYLSSEAIREMFMQMKGLCSGSKFVTTFMLPIDCVAEKDKPGYEMSMKGAARSGNPFISFFARDSMALFLEKMGFSQFQMISTTELYSDFFEGRNDNLKPSTGEEILIIDIK